MQTQEDRSTTTFSTRMPQQSKLIRSRDEWRTKAVQRANEIREYRKTHRRNREHIAELKQQLNVLQQAVDADKKNS